MSNRSFVTALTRQNNNTRSTASYMSQNLSGYNDVLGSNTSTTSSQYVNKMLKFQKMYQARGLSENAALNRVMANFTRAAKTQDQRLRIKRAFDKVKNKTRRAGVATGRAARVPNKGIRRGLFGAMQRMQQFRAGNVTSQRSYSNFNRVKSDIISEADRTKAAWNGYFKRQHETLKTQSSEITKRLNSKKVNDIQKALKAAQANHSRKAKAAAKAERWGAKRNAIRY